MPQTTIPYDQYFFERLGPVLKARRQKLKFTQKQLAAEVGISPSYIGYIEKGAPSLDLVTFVNLLEKLGFEYEFHGGQVAATRLCLTPTEDPTVELTNVEVEPFAPPQPLTLPKPLPFLEEVTSKLPVEQDSPQIFHQRGGYRPGFLNDFSMWFKRRFS